MKDILEAATFLIMEHLPNCNDIEAYQSYAVYGNEHDHWIKTIYFRHSITDKPLTAKIDIKGTRIRAYSCINGKTYFADLADPAFPITIATQILNSQR